MNAVEKQVRELVGVELAAANKRFPQFRSAHEGIAVIWEEVQEVEEEVKEMAEHAEELWMWIRGNIRTKTKTEILYKTAIKAACEAIQVAAMAQKFLDMLAVQKKGTT